MMNSIIVLLAIMSAFSSIGAWYWLTDPKTAVVPLTESLLNHYIFVIAAFILCKFEFGIENTIFHESHRYINIFL